MHFCVGLPVLRIKQSKEVVSVHETCALSGYLRKLFAIINPYNCVDCEIHLQTIVLNVPWNTALRYIPSINTKLLVNNDRLMNHRNGCCF